MARMGHHVTIMAPKHNGQLLSIAESPILDKAFQSDRFVHEGVHFVAYHATKIKEAKQVARMQQKMVQNLKNQVKPYFVDALGTASLQEKADVYHAHEWETLYEAIQIKRMLKKKNRSVKVIFDAHELEEDNLLLKLLMREVDHMITVSDSLKKIYASRYPKMPISLIYNSPPFLEQVPSVLKNKNWLFAASKPFTIAYEGTLSKKKGDPYKIIEIVNLLKEARIDAKFNILGNVSLGDTAETNKVISALKSHPNIEYGWVDFKDLPQYWAKVDIGYIYFDLNNQNRVNALPNKFFSYLNSGIPVIVNAASEMERIITKYQCGIVIKKKSPTASDYAAHLLSLHKNRELLKRLSLNAREIMRTLYCWEKMEERLAGIMKSLKKK